MRKYLYCPGKMIHCILVFLQKNKKYWLSKQIAPPELEREQLKQLADLLPIELLNYAKGIKLWLQQKEKIPMM